MKNILRIMYIITTVAIYAQAGWNQGLERWEIDCNSGIGGEGCSIAGSMYEDGHYAKWDGRHNIEYQAKPNPGKALKLYERGCSLGDKIACDHYKKLSQRITASTLSAKTSPIETKATYRILADKLGHYGGAAAYGFDGADHQKLLHQLVGFYDIPHADATTKLAIASSVPAKNHDCHACAAKMSFFLFRWSGTGWELTKSYINAHSMGEWGSAPAKSDYQVVTLGEHDFGLFLKVGWATQGYAGNRIFLYSFEQEHAVEILDIESALSDLATGNPSRVNWQSKFRFVRGAGGFYDILLHRWGLEEGRRIDENIRYIYRNGKYQKTTPAANGNRPLQNDVKPSSRRIVSKRLRGGYRAVVTLGEEHFKFELSGNGDTVDLAFTKDTLLSSHMFGVVTECQREGKTKLTHCEDLGTSLDPDSPTLHYKKDDKSFEVIIAYTDGGIAYKTMLYSDEKYIYWANYRAGRVVSLDKFEIQLR